MAEARLSVVVVSWGLPRALARCLTAIGQMRSTRFEVIVVADADGLDVARALPCSGRMTLLSQVAPNISAARNLGIAASAGDVIGFIDADAVPQPGWAEAILAGFETPDVSAVTGPVLGGDGISLQWGRMAADRLGRDRWLEAACDPGPDEVLKLHGTNMAYRRAAFARHGGFNTGFRFHLDDTDMAGRLKAEAARVHYLPDAVVHHGFGASARRRAEAVPNSLHDIGVWKALFLRKHDPGAVDAGLEQLMTDQRTRLLRLSRKRRIGPSDMRALMESLVAGIAEGRTRSGLVPAVPEVPGRSFAAFRTGLPPAMKIWDGWMHNASRLRDAAAADIASGQPAALILLEPSLRRHRVDFTEGGWWEQRGGLYGPSEPGSPRLQIWRYRDRMAAEMARFFHRFPFDDRFCS
jgi:GT2 family glycosyltransferase